MAERAKRQSARECDIAHMEPGTNSAIVGVVVSADESHLNAVLSDATGQCRVVVGAEMLKDLKEGSVVRITGVPFDDGGQKALEAAFVSDMTGVDADLLLRVREAEKKARKGP